MTQPVYNTTYLCFAGDDILIEAKFFAQGSKMFVMNKSSPQDLYQELRVAKYIELELENIKVLIIIIQQDSSIYMYDLYQGCI